MFFYEGMTCPVCEQPFSANEDIVACPRCGLPHHRLCWQRDGRCHLDHLHNTPEQWDRNKNQYTADKGVPADQTMQTCSHCGAKNPEYAEFCKRCGNTLQQAEWHSSAANPYNEYKPFRANYNDETRFPEDDLLDGISTRDYSAVISVRTDYYIPKFRQLSHTNSGGWNWSAFLLGPYWLLYRKMYVGGSLFLLLQLFQTAVAGYALEQLGITLPYTYEQIYNTVDTALTDRGQLLYLLSFWLLSAIMLLIRFVIGAAGNRIYKQHCTSVIQKARKRYPDISSSELATNGGTSFGVAAIGYFALSFLSQMVTMLFI